MAETISDLLQEIQGIGQQSGEGVLTGATELQGSLKSMAAAFDDSSEGTFKASSELQKALESMTGQALANIKRTKELLHNDRITSKSANASIKRQMKVVAELTSDIEQESKTRELGRKDFEKMQGAVKEVNDGLLDEIKLIESKNKEEKNGALERKVIARAEKREREKERRAAAEQRREDAKGLAESLENRLGSLGMGAGLVAGAKGSLGSRLGGKKGIAAAAGVGIGFGLLSKAATNQARALDVVSGRAANYGYTMGNLNAELLITETAIASVRKEAVSLGVDADQAMGLMKGIGTQTGESFAAIQPVMSEMMALSAAGVASLDDLSADLVYQINSVGLSSKDAGEALLDVAGIGKSTSIQMDDFYKSVKSVSDAVGALTSDHKGLARTMAFAIKSSDKLGISYDRRVKAAQGLTQALTSSYNSNYATLNVRKELQIAMASDNKSLVKQAQRINEALRKNTITGVRAAEMLKGTGGSQDIGVITSRAEKLARTMMPGGGGMEVARNMLGDVDMSIDMLGIIQDWSSELAKNGGSFKKAVESIDARKGKDSLKAFTKEMKDKGKTAGRLADATMEELTDSLTKLMKPILDKLPRVLTDLTWSINALVSWLPGSKGAKLTEEEKRKQALIKGGMDKGMAEERSRRELTRAEEIMGKDIDGNTNKDLLKKARKQASVEEDRVQALSGVSNMKYEDMDKVDQIMVDAARAKVKAEVDGGIWNNISAALLASKTIGQEMPFDKTKQSMAGMIQGLEGGAGDNPFQRLMNDEGLQKKFRKKFKGGLVPQQMGAFRSAFSGLGADTNKINQLLSSIDRTQPAIPNSAVIKNGKIGPDGTVRGELTIGFRQPGANNMAEVISNPAAEVIRDNSGG